jgi:hypothetical protein
LLGDNLFVQEELVEAASYLCITPRPQRCPQHSADETTARFSAFAGGSVDRFGDIFRWYDP